MAGDQRDRNRGFVPRMLREHLPGLLSQCDPERRGRTSTGTSSTPWRWTMAPPKMAEIQQRLGVDVNDASQYRLRLIAAELIQSTRRGYVDFALPYLRQYLGDRLTPTA